MKYFTIIIIICSAVKMSFAWQNNLVNEEPLTDTLKTEEVKKNELKISLSSTFVSTHLWRGISAGTAPCIEPILTLSKGGLSFSAWSCYAVDNSYREIDFFVTYRWKFIEVGLFDYYCPTPQTRMNDFSQFEKGKTQHLFEAQASFFGPKKWPLKLTTACFIGGADYDEKGEQLYSTYFELAYQFKMKDYKLDLELGTTPHRSMYAQQASLFNCGFSVSKDIKINDKWTIPAQYKLVYNVEQKDMYFIVSFTLS